VNQQDENIHGNMQTQICLENGAIKLTDCVSK